MNKLQKWLKPTSMLREVLKVDKRLALRLIKIIKAYHDCNASHYKREGSLFKTSELGGFEQTELTAASLAKFTISPVGFEHSLACEKFESQNLRNYISPFVFYI